MSILTGQTKLNEALHDDACDGNWTLRVNDPCNGDKLDKISTQFSPPFNSKYIKKTVGTYTDLYEYYADDTQALLLKSVLVTYSDLAKENLSTVKVTP